MSSNCRPRCPPGTHRVDYCCPRNPDSEIGRAVSSIIRTMFFTLCTVFLLLVPLGDPKIKCPKTVKLDPNSETFIFDCMCGMHRTFVYIVDYSAHLLEAAVHHGGSFLRNKLYDTKIMFYTILEAIDKNDLQKVVCSEMPKLSYYEEPNLIKQKKKKIPKRRSRQANYNYK